MPNRVARVLYFSRSAFVLYSRTSSSSEIVVVIVEIVCDLSSHCQCVCPPDVDDRYFIPRIP